QQALGSRRRAADAAVECRMNSLRSICWLALCLVTPLAALAQRPADAPSTPRIYVFDNGAIRGLDPALFNFTAEELAEVDFVNVSYLIVHPEGTLMFEAGAIPDGHFPADGGEAVEGVMAATRPLRPQLESVGHSPSDVTYFAMSHYHSDHTGNANDFADATWIVQRAEL